MKQKMKYRLDLTKMNGNGDFSCPKCGAAISPDDHTEEAYSILEAKVDHQGLKEVIIRCNSCSSYLHLSGFYLLQNLPEIDEEKLENKKTEETPCYINHQ